MVALSNAISSTVGTQHIINKIRADKRSNVLGITGDSKIMTADSAFKKDVDAREIIGSAQNRSRILIF